MHNIKNGKIAEDLATEFLTKKGYHLVERNWRFSRGEIDIIVKKDDVLIFVEVKSRKGSYFGYPEEAVTDKKQDIILSTAEQYVERSGWNGRIRFDIIAITKRDEIVHFEDAF